MAKDQQASLPLIHLLNRGLSMAQAKTALREAKKGSEEKAQAPKKKTAPKKQAPSSDGEEGPENTKPEWLE